MIGSLVLLGERLAGHSDPRLRRGLVLAFGEAVTTAVPYVLVLIFVRAALEHRLSLSLTSMLAGGIAAASVARLLFAGRAMANIFVAAHALMGHARIRAADHLRRLPMGFFAGRRSGDLTGVLTTDLALVEDVWSHLIGIFAPSFALPMVVGAGLCFLDLWLGVAILAMLPVALAVLMLTAPIFVRQIGAVLEATSDVNARIVEYVQGVTVLRAFGRHGDIFQRLAKSILRLRDVAIHAEILPSPLLSVFGFVVEATFVVVAYVGSARALAGAISPATLLTFLVISIGVTRQAAELGVAFLMLRGSQRALSRIDELMAQAALDESTKAVDDIRRFDVRIENVSFGYDGSFVLDRVSTTFPAKALTAIVGASGSGKSTLVHLIARLWDVPRDNGTIRIGGVDIRDVPVEELHRHIAMVFQDVVLFSGTVADNIRIGHSDASFEAVVKAAKAARAHAFITALPKGYDTEIGEGGGMLSGGERQRISIARALLKDAPIVLLDEATASVDASAESQIQRAINELVRDKTVVVIAHRLRTVRRAHTIVVLDRGSVVDSGTHDELVNRPGPYATLWREQERAKGWRLQRDEGPARINAEAI